MITHKTSHYVPLHLNLCLQFIKITDDLLEEGINTLIEVISELSQEIMIYFLKKLSKSLITDLMN